MRTDEVMTRTARRIKANIPEVNSVMAISGHSMIGGRGENQGMLVCDLLKWDQRKKPEQHVQFVMKRIQDLVNSEPRRLTVTSPRLNSRKAALLRRGTCCS